MHMRLTQSGSIARERFLPFTLVLVIAVLVALPALAYSDPPDPTWISGFWDDDDFDNVVEAVTNTLLGDGSGPAVGVHIEPGPSFLPLPSECSEHPVLCPLDWFAGRAPPHG
jgi:hypothetical protein